MAPHLVLGVTHCLQFQLSSKLNGESLPHSLIFGVGKHVVHVDDHHHLHFSVSDHMEHAWVGLLLLKLDRQHVVAEFAIPAPSRLYEPVDRLNQHPNCLRKLLILVENLNAYISSSVSAFKNACFISKWHRFPSLAAADPSVPRCRTPTHSPCHFARRFFRPSKKQIARRQTIPMCTRRLLVRDDIIAGKLPLLVSFRSEGTIAPLNLVDLAAGPALLLSPSRDPATPPASPP